MRIGIYPGSFDPITNGHLDIIERGRKLFDKLYIVLSINPNKKTLFTLDERIALLKEVTKEFDNVDIATTDKLTVDCAKELGANFMLRGLRAVTDFEYELQINLFNKALNNDIETIFIMSANEYNFLSSSSVKEVALFGGDISKFVPKCVETAIHEKINK